MKPQPYDYEKAAKLENYIRKRYPNQLSNGAMQLYFALPYLERSGLGLCQPITANYHQLKNASFHSVGPVKKHLKELSGVLCEVEIGKPIKDGKEATQIRRYSLQELMHGEPARKLIDYTPPDAKRLVEILTGRAFVYGDDPACKPSWNVSRTGRIQSTRPNVQTDSELKRAKNLCVGLKPGQALIYADFKSAEPVVTKHILGAGFDGCTYEALMRLQGIDKDAAKKKVNTLAYARSAVRIVEHWSAEVQALFMPYAEALDSQKEKIWSIGKPRNKQRRFVHTLGASKIVAVKGDPPHKGQLLNWQIQGTVADILNGACLKIIEQEESKGWKFCFPEHDAVYVIGTPEHAAEIKALMAAEAKRLNLSLLVDADIHFKD